MSFDKFLKPRYIYILSAIYCIIILFVYKVQLSGDAQSYISAWEVFKNGSIDMWRTPVYPIFLGFLKSLFGNAHYLLIAVVVHHLVFLVSIRYFYLLLKEVVKNGKIAFGVTAFYAFYPCVQTYNSYVQTETFAVVGTIFFLYSTFRLYKDEKIIFGIESFCWLFFLVFLRPSSTYLIPVIFLFWLFKAIKLKSFLTPSFFCGFGGSVIVGLLLIIYSFNFKSSYGLFSPSGIGVINKYCIARQACIIEPMVSCEVYKKKDFKGCVFDHDVAPMLPEVFYESECAISEFGLKVFSDSVNAVLSQHKFSYLKRIAINVQRSCADRLMGTTWPMSKLLDIITVNLCCIFILFLLYIYILVKLMREKRKIYFSLLLCIISISHMSVIFLASPDDYARLTLPIIPVLLIMIGQMFSTVKVDFRSCIDFI